MLTWQCKYRHKPWMTTYNSINSNKTWCPVCSNKPHLSIEDCHLTAKERRGVCLSSVYLDGESPLTWQCEYSHKPWQATYNSVRNKNSWCPYCSHRRSRAESEIYDLIENIYPDSLSGVKKLLSSKGFQLDIFIPSLKVAIEYDGPRHDLRQLLYSKEQFAVHYTQIEQCKDGKILLIRIKERYYKFFHKQYEKEIIFLAIK